MCLYVYLVFFAAVDGASSMHRCWGKSFNFIIWVGWHACSLFHWTLDVIKAHKHRIFAFAIEIAIRISFLLNFKQCELKLRNTHTHQSKKSKNDAKKQKIRTVKRNKNNHEIVVNLVVSHWRSSVFIQKISFFATKLTLWSKRKHHPNRWENHPSPNKKNIERAQNRNGREEKVRERETEIRSCLTIHGMLNPNVFVSLFILRFYVGNIYLSYAHMHTLTPLPSPTPASN